MHGNGTDFLARLTLCVDPWCGILFVQRPLLLAKILGIYTVGFKNTKTGNSKRLDVVIMENILYGCRSQKVRST